MARHVKIEEATVPEASSPPRQPAARPTLQRTTFRTSRLLDFCSRKELIAQTGHQPDDWPLVALKELVDNAIDACEDAAIPPDVRITVDDAGITVADNGPGIPAPTIDGVLDFNVRVSSREAYVAPDRGRQGNALKTLVVMPFVLAAAGGAGEGRVAVDAGGVRHAITLGVDRLRQTPVIHHAKGPSEVKNGTVVRLCWPDSASSILHDARDRFLQIAADYTLINPHLCLSVDWHGERWEAAATAPAWAKWRPNDPTSPHWYRVEDLERLIAANVAHAADAGTPARPVREFVAEFRGLSGSAKQKRVLDRTGYARTSLSDLVRDGEIDRAAATRLLSAMRVASKPVKPAALGIIGEQHLRRRIEEIGCAMETFGYRRTCGATDGLPWIIEVAFAAYTEALEPVSGEPRPRRLITGVNWSPGIINPFRELGRVGQSLDSLLAEQRAGADEPVVMVLHLACPRVEYMDRGKSSIVVPRASASSNAGNGDTHFLQIDGDGEGDGDVTEGES